MAHHDTGVKTKSVVVIGDDKFNINKAPDIIYGFNWTNTIANVRMMPAIRLFVKLGYCGGRMCCALDAVITVNIRTIDNSWFHFIGLTLFFDFLPNVCSNLMQQPSTKFLTKLL